MHYLCSSYNLIEGRDTPYTAFWNSIFIANLTFPHGAVMCKVLSCWGSLSGSDVINTWVQFRPLEPTRRPRSKCFHSIVLKGSDALIFCSRQMDMSYTEPLHDPPCLFVLKVKGKKPCPDLLTTSANKANKRHRWETSKRTASMGGHYFCSCMLKY